MVAMKVLDKAVDVTKMPEDEAIAWLMQAHDLTKQEAEQRLAISKGEVTHDQKIIVDGEELTLV
jgi:uncharacterized protein (DUF2384 family)